MNITPQGSKQMIECYISLFFLIKLNLTPNPHCTKLVGSSA